MSVFTIAALSRVLGIDRRAVQAIADEGVLEPLPAQPGNPRLFNTVELDIARALVPLMSGQHWTRQLKAIARTLRWALGPPDPETIRGKKAAQWSRNGVPEAFKAARQGDEDALLAFVVSTRPGGEVSASAYGFTDWTSLASLKGKAGVSASIILVDLTAALRGPEFEEEEQNDE